MTTYGIIFLIADSAEECNKILAKKQDVQLDEILTRKYNWYKSQKHTTGISRYLGHSKNCPI